MRKLKIGEIIKFSFHDEFTGEKVHMIGTVIGDHKAVKARFPRECAEVDEQYYLIYIANHSGLFVVPAEVVEETLGEVIA